MLDSLTLVELTCSQPSVLTAAEKHKYHWLCVAAVFPSHSGSQGHAQQLKGWSQRHQASRDCVCTTLAPISANNSWKLPGPAASLGQPSARPWGRNWFKNNICGQQGQQTCISSCWGKAWVATWCFLIKTCLKNGIGTDVCAQSVHWADDFWGLVLLMQSSSGCCRCLLHDWVVHMEKQLSRNSFCSDVLK